MVACAESHFGIYHYVIWQTGYVGVKRAVYHTLIINDDRFEIIFLPFRIPIPALDCRPSDFNRGFKREIGYYFLEHRFIKKLFFYVCCQSVVIGYKTFVILVA